MKGILGVKVGMTQVFNEQGVATPVTLIQAGPCFVTQIKTNETDGYEAIQLGFGETKERRLTKGEKGHLGLLKQDVKHPNRKKNFGVGDRVDVMGTTKGRGLAGVVKRYGFAGGPKTHGQSDRQRAPGSIGATSGTAHVFKGKKMPGRMGNERFTSQNLEVMRIDAEKNLIAVKGAVPGVKGGLVVIRDAAKN